MGDEIGACFQNGSTAGKVFSGAKVVEGSDEVGQVKASTEKKTLPRASSTFRAVTEASSLTT